MFNPDLLELPQKERILTALKDRKAKGLYVWELSGPRPSGLGIAQYNARIKELRDVGHDIVNTVPGHFVLKEFYNAPKIKADQVEAQLRTLRIEWAKHKDNPSKQQQITLRAMPLKRLLTTIKLEENVTQTLF